MKIYGYVPLDTHARIARGLASSVSCGSLSSLRFVVDIRRSQQSFLWEHLSLAWCHISEVIQVRKSINANDVLMFSGRQYGIYRTA